MSETITTAIHANGGRLAAVAAWLDTRRGVRLALFAWISVSLVEYVILGSRSFVWMDDEGELLVTHYNLLNRFHSAGQYSHLLQSGVDVIAAFFYGATFLSFDRALLDIFPLWIGIAIHKAFTFAIGAWGTYIACRRGLNCTRSASIVFGFLFMVMYYRLQIVTFGTGTSFALLPLGVYLCVVRSGRSRYWMGVFAYAAIFAAAATFHGVPPLVSALIAAAALFGKIHFRIFLAAGAVVLVFLANNAESFVALVGVAPHSVRGSVNFNVALPFAETFFKELADGIRYIIYLPVVFLLLVFSATVFTVRWDWILLFRLVIAILVPPLAMALFAAFPWQAINLSPIRNAPYGFFIMGWLPLAALAGAKAVDLTADFLGHRFADRWRSVPALAVLGIAVVILGHYKIHNFRAWLTMAGQSAYATIDNWMPAEPFRAISFSHKQMMPAANVFASFYGVAMFDAWTNLTLLEHTAYWKGGVRKDDDERGWIGLDWRYIDTQDALRYRIGEQVSLPLLATANVRYIFSPVPLREEGVRFVDGPVHPPLDKGLMKVTGEAARYQGPAWKRTLDRWRWQLDRVFHYGKVYVYEIEDALPRVYAARGISIVPDDADWPAYFTLLEKLGPQRIAMVRAHDASPIAGLATTAEVNGFDLVVDGFDVRVDAPEGGVIVINAVHQPFFVATVDGRVAPLVAVNGIQTAVPVSAGGRELKVRYHRPTAGEKGRDVLCGFGRHLGMRICGDSR